MSNMPLNKNNGSVFIYHSLLMTISDPLMNMVCSFFKCSSTDRLNFDVVNVLRQRNDYDCGVFSIAFATELAFGGDPANCTWSTAVMRSHLLQALELKDLKSFPKLGQHAIHPGRKLYKTRQIVIYCTCRMPNDPKKRNGAVLLMPKVIAH